MNPRLVMARQPKNFLSQRKRNKEKFKFGYTSTYVGMLAVIACLFIYYVIGLNTSATLGYDKLDLENTQKELKVELERLNVKIAEIESSDAIGSDEVLENMMEEYEDPNYLVIRTWVQYVYNN